RNVLVFDDAEPRPATVPLFVRSLYVRPSDGAIFGIGDRAANYDDPRITSFEVDPSGVSEAWSIPVDPDWNDGSLTWNERLVAGRNPFIAPLFDLNAAVTLGT